MTLLVVYHEFAIGTLTERITDEIMVAYAASPLARHSSVLFTSDDGLLGEFPGIRAAWQAAQTDETLTHVGYLHSKGATHPDNPCVADWRRYMLYFFLRGPGPTQEVTGVDWTEDENRRWFAGNYWWATTEYLRALPEPKPVKDRLEWEFWLGQNNPTTLNRYSSDVNHYHTRYRPPLYLGKGL